MRHLKHRSALGRTKEHRAALMANLSAALLTHGRIETTLPKAKALRPYVEKVITLAKKADGAPAATAVHLRRQAIAKVRQPAPVAKLFRERASEFKDRPGGYTRIYKLGQRSSDGTEMALITLISGSDTGYDKRTRKTAPEAKPAEVAAPAADEVEATAPEAQVEDTAPAAETEEPKAE